MGRDNKRTSTCDSTVCARLSVCWSDTLADDDEYEAFRFSFGETVPEEEKTPAGDDGSVVWPPSEA